MAVDETRDALVHRQEKREISQRKMSRQSSPLFASVTFPPKSLLFLRKKKEVGLSSEKIE